MWVLIVFMMCKWDPGVTTVTVPGFTTKANCDAAAQSMVFPDAYRPTYQCVQVK